jgi:hypothetical protein
MELVWLARKINTNHPYFHKWIKHKKVGCMESTLIQTLCFRQTDMKLMPVSGVQIKFYTHINIKDSWKETSLSANNLPLTSACHSRIVI